MALNSVLKSNFELETPYHHFQGILRCSIIVVIKNYNILKIIYVTSFIFIPHIFVFCVKKHPVHTLFYTTYLLSRFPKKTWKILRKK